MLDFEVQRSSRRCAKTEREFAPGEAFYSVLMRDGAEIVRQDFCEQAWEGPPEESLGWWKTSMPTPDARKMHWAPNDVILHYFEQLEGREDKEDVRYVLALLMLRRKIARLQQAETDEHGREVLVMFCPRNENEYRAAVTPPSAERIEAVQAELGHLLFGDAA